MQYVNPVFLLLNLDIALSAWLTTIPENIYLLKVNYRNTKKRYEICLKLTIKTPERRRWCRSDVFIFNFDSIVDFEPANVF